METNCRTIAFETRNYRLVGRFRSSAVGRCFEVGF
jgi:hypothetical protein